MKEVKFLLVILCSAIYTSAIWMAIIFPFRSGLGILGLVIVVVGGASIIGASIGYLTNNWEK